MAHQNTMIIKPYSRLFRSIMPTRVAVEQAPRSFGANPSLRRATSVARQSDAVHLYRSEAIRTSQIPSALQTDRGRCHPNTRLSNNRPVWLGTKIRDQNKDRLAE